jgi:hypothetical protein
MNTENERDKLQRFLDEQFADSVANPMRWFDTAENLIETARNIEDDLPPRWKGAGLDESYDPRTYGTESSKAFRLLDIYFMLTGFAIENLLKGLLVALKQEHFKEEALQARRLPTELHNHSLHEIALAVGFAPNHQERSILRKLEDHLLWAGRYPVPTTPGSYEDAIGGPLRTTSFAREYSNTDVQEIKQFLERLLIAARATKARISS